MSRWIPDDLFEEYKNEKVNEQTTTKQYNVSNIVWPSPEKPNDHEKPMNEYEGRFLTDPTGKFEVKYYYHMWPTSELTESGKNKWHFNICPKTWDINAFCAECAVSSVLWKGNQDDKNRAKQMFKKERHAINWYVIDDPRDTKIEDEDKKLAGKVMINQIPAKVEAKIKDEVVSKRGIGKLAFDPGEEGFNFIIKVGCTKPEGKQGKTFPTYDLSGFDRFPKALGTEEEIEDIMSRRHDLNEFVKNQMKDKKYLYDLLDKELLLDFVVKEWAKHEDLSAFRNKSTDQQEEQKSPPKMEDKTETPEMPENLNDDLPWEDDNVKTSKSNKDKNVALSETDKNVLNELEEMFGSSDNIPF
jgi:hypothetical protein